MNDLLTALRLHLLDVPGVATAVETRIYPDRLPQKRDGEISGGLPALVLAEISEPLTDAEGCGDNGVVARRVQVDCYAETGEAARELERVVKTAVHGACGSWAGLRVMSAFRVGRFNNPAPEINLGRVTADYQIMFDGGV